MADQDSAPAPMMRYEPDGRAPVLSYNVPEPVSFSSRSVIELANLPVKFNETANQVPPERMPVDQLRTLDATAIHRALTTGDLRVFPGIRDPAGGHEQLFAAQTAVVNAGQSLDHTTVGLLAQGVAGRSVLPPLSDLVAPATFPPPGTAGTEQLVREAAMAVGPMAYYPAPTRLATAVGAAASAADMLSAQSVQRSLVNLSVEEIQAQAQQGRRLNVFRSLWGTYRYNWLAEPVRARPRIMLVFTYRLSSFLGAYGAGRTLKTFSLLPGEKTTISMKTWTKTESERKQASSILDSVTEEACQDFENAVQDEQTSKDAKQDSFEYHVDAEASGSWGFASAKVDAGVKGGMASQHEQTSKNVTNAVNKHASKSSAKRDVNVNTSAEVKESSGEETSITREIANINVGRTLNFAFRQLNQEHISLLHVTDVHVGFFNGYGESSREVPLHEVDELLEQVCAGDTTAAKAVIMEAAGTVWNHLGDPVRFVEQRTVPGSDGETYWRVIPQRSSFTDPATGDAFEVDGVITAVSRFTMRTEGVIVDALLGQGDALDGYSHGIQDAAVDDRQADVAQKLLARQIVSAATGDQADAFRKVYFPPVEGAPVNVTVNTDGAGSGTSGGAGATTGGSM